MQNFAGSPPRGDNFFQRQSLLKKLYRQLNNGGHLYLTAPRHMGKTATMWYLADNHTDDFYAIYIITESIRDSESFYKHLLNELYQQRKSWLSNRWHQATELFNQFEIGGFFLEFAVAKNRPSNYYQQKFTDLVRGLKHNDGLKLVIMVDEFPQTVRNIMQDHSDQAAIQFLQSNRSLRQSLSEHVIFLYTGSSGLHALVTQLNISETINDIQSFNIPPFSTNEARQLIKALFKTEQIACSDNSIDYLLNKLHWLNPYFIQLLVEKLINFHDESPNQPIGKAQIEQAFQQLLEHRHRANVEHYYERLEKIYQGEQLQQVKQFLQRLAQQKVLSLSDIETIIPAPNTDFMLSALVFDGYIFEENNQYRFVSPILQQWWLRYVR